MTRLLWENRRQMETFHRWQTVVGPVMNYLFSSFCLQLGGSQPPGWYLPGGGGPGDMSWPLNFKLCH